MEPKGSPMEPDAAPKGAKGSQMELPGERKGAKMGPKPAQDTPDTSQDVQWIENGAKMKTSALGFARIP